MMVTFIFPAWIVFHVDHSKVSSEVQNWFLWEFLEVLGVG